MYIEQLQVVTLLTFTVTVDSQKMSQYLQNGNLSKSGVTTGKCKKIFLEYLIIRRGTGKFMIFISVFRSVKVIVFFSSMILIIEVLWIL